MSCPFKDALGKPGTGFHERRILGLAANDVVGTLALALAFPPPSFGLWRQRSVNGYAASVVAWFLLAIAVHRAFCVDTALNVAIFGAAPP
jgi:hypothetical protein